MGKFNNAQRLQLNGVKATIKHRMNMQKIKLKIMTVITKNLDGPFENYLHGNHEPHIDSSSRFNFALVSIVAEMFNLS
jgi:hypothetical protein